MNQLKTVLDALIEVSTDLYSYRQHKQHNEAIAIVEQMIRAEPVAIAEGSHLYWISGYQPEDEESDTYLFSAPVAPQAVPAEPSCPDCHAPHLLYECVHCSASNYPAAPVVKEYEMEPHDQNWIHGEDV